LKYYLSFAVMLWLDHSIQTVKHQPILRGFAVKPQDDVTCLLKIDYDKISTKNKQNLIKNVFICAVQEALTSL